MKKGFFGRYFGKKNSPPKNEVINEYDLSFEEDLQLEDEEDFCEDEEGELW